MQENGANAYLANKVMTASPQELVLMLYDGMLKFCTKAINAIDNDKTEEAHNAITRVQNILEEFMVNLDKKQELGVNLYSLYDYMYRRMVEANFKKDKDIINEVYGMIKELRDTWKEAMNLAKTGTNNAVNQ